ncbi:sulfurtransferase [uncultured Microbacterium sp.]|uniref:Putative thiosulfate sulfurtransferase SseB n=1 Tax=uncultured Microbacterium sp. TaxID=191216 RepID=A0A1Y5P7P9_9MICO|nr:sulfurtransferase [uncultured Microbacterium sp.]SBS71958.1 putative thiosulfate sulfurtransferase SseB [uncultured Microbacterium sp.]
MGAELITPAELSRSLRSERPPVVLDIRWRLDAPDGRDAYRAGHIPGAVYVSLDDELAGHGGPTAGRHPLPDPADFEAAARGWGLNDGDAVVVYDDWQSFGAARAWWMLTDAGVADVRLLEGGLAAWRSAGLPLEAGAFEPRRGTVTLHPGHLPQLTIDEAAALPARGALLDVRAGERYRGETEPIDPQAGHIPGALHLPTTESLDADGRFLPGDALRARVEALGVDGPVGVYCGSGVSAAHAVFALQRAGLDPALYVGSWSQWSNHPDRPVATGAQP